MFHLFPLRKSIFDCILIGRILILVYGEAWTRILWYSEDAYVDVGHESNPLTNENYRSSEKGITIARTEASIVGTCIEGIMILRNILPIPRVIDQNESTGIETLRGK